MEVKVQGMTEIERPKTGLEIRGSNGSKCYHVFSFAMRMLMW